MTGWGNNGNVENEYINYALEEIGLFPYDWNEHFFSGWVIKGILKIME